MSQLHTQYVTVNVNVHVCAGYTCECTRVVMILVSESESKPGLLESELESKSHHAGIGIRIIIKFFGKRWNRDQNWNHLLLESEMKS